jgi:hypothetical protein
MKQIQMSFVNSLHTLSNPRCGIKHDKEGPRMAEQSSVSPISTFVVRFWQEWSAAGSRWRGHIEHVQSGESAAFLDLDEMLDFVRRIGVMGGNESQPTRETE